MISVFDFMTPHEIRGVIAGMSLPGVDARALQSFFSAVQNSGPGRYLIPPYTFKVEPPVLSPGGDPTIFDPRPGLFSLSGVRNVVISADGATIQVLDDRSLYTPYLCAPSGWGGILLKLNRCEKLHILGLRIQAAVVRGLREDGQDLYPKPKLGMELIDFRDGTVGLAPGEGSGINEDIRFNNDILLDVTFIGGLYGVSFAAPRGNPELAARNIVLHMRAQDTYYPLLCEASGSQLQADLHTVMCGRNCMMWGIEGNTISVLSRNQRGSTEIASYSHRGCTNIQLRYRDRDSNYSWPVPAILVQWTDSDSTHRNIKIDLDIKNDSAQPFGSSIAFNRAVPGHHVLEGFEVTGIAEQVQSTFSNAGIEFAQNGEQRGIYVHDLICKQPVGSSVAKVGNLGLDLTGLRDIAHFENIYTDCAFKIFAPAGNTISFGVSRISSFTIDGGNMTARAEAKVWLYYDTRSGSVTKPDPSLNVQSVVAHPSIPRRYVVAFAVPFVNEQYAALAAYTEGPVHISSNAPGSIELQIMTEEDPPNGQLCLAIFGDLVHAP